MTRNGFGAAHAHLQAVLKLSEQEADATLRARCLSRALTCPRCQETRIYELSSSRLRCSRCLLTFGVFTGRWISWLKVPARSKLILLKSFELGLTTQETACLVRACKDTVQRAFRTIRLSLAARDPLWVPLLPALQDDGEVPLPGLFGVERDEGRVRVRPVHEAGPEAHRAIDPTRILHMNGFVYAAGRSGYDALIYNGKWPGRTKTAGLKACTREPFLAFILNQMGRRFGVSRRALPLFLKEWELRFNLFGQPFFEHLLDSLARRMPLQPGRVKTSDSPGAAGLNSPQVHFRPKSAPSAPARATRYRYDE